MIHDQASNLRKRLAHLKMANNQIYQGAKTISIVSGKGGVGKSNFAINFCLELLDRQKKTIIIDLDIGMGNIDVLLGLHAQYTIVDMIDNKLSIESIIEKGPKNLYYIAGGSGLTTFFSLNQAKTDYFLNEYGKLVKRYDYIIFDMGAGASSDSLSFILASDECIVITTPEPASITDAYGMVKHIVNNKENIPIYVVMNRCLTYKDGERALKRFQHVIFRFLHIKIKKLGVLLEDKIVTTAAMRQTPIVLLNKSSSVAKSIRLMTANYLAHSIKFKPKPVSFIDRLKKLIGKG